MTESAIEFDAPATEHTPKPPRKDELCIREGCAFRRWKTVTKLCYNHQRELEAQEKQPRSRRKHEQGTDSSRD